MATGAAYNASKFALVGMTEAAMLDLRADGVRVAAILPGSVATGFGRATGDDRWKLQAEDVARAVVDLLDFPGRALPSVVELRPTHTAKTWAARQQPGTSAADVSLGASFTELVKSVGAGAWVGSVVE